MSFFRSFLAVLLLGGALPLNAAELRVLTHNSFALPKSLLAQFEKEHEVSLVIIKAGDAGQMLNKLILTRASPIADVVYGIDNTLIGKALAAGVLDFPHDKYKIDDATLAGAGINYGFVALNIDKAWFAKQRVPLPQSLKALTEPAYRKLLVVENPATSSAGLSFLLATIYAMGEEEAFVFWGKLRDNGLKVAKGWTDAYRTDFSLNGGSYPMVVSYATSPAAEAFYSKTPTAQPPTENLFLAGGVFRQIEGAFLINGGKAPKLARQFIAFLQSPAVQKEIATSMWMYPVLEGVPEPSVYQFASKPAQHDTFDSQTITAQSAKWIKRWVSVVLR